MGRPGKLLSSIDTRCPQNESEAGGNLVVKRVWRYRFIQHCGSAMAGGKAALKFRGGSLPLGLDA